MQVRPSRGYGNILAAMLSKTALKKAQEDIDSKVTSGMTWEEAGKALEGSLGGIEYASKHEVLEMLEKMASKGLRTGGNEAMEKEAQHWIGRGLNMLKDVGKGVWDAAGNAGKGIADWGKGKMNDANQWQQIQPKLQAIREALDFVEKNPNSLSGMMPQIMKHVQSLGQPEGAPAAATPAVPNAPATPAATQPFSGQKGNAGCPPGTTPTPQGCAPTGVQKTPRFPPPVGKPRNKVLPL